MIILVSSFTQCKTAKSTRLDLKGDKNLNKTIILFLSKDQMIMENVEKEVKELEILIPLTIRIRKSVTS